MRTRLSYFIAAFFVVILIILSLPLITGILFKKNFYKTLAIMSADTKMNFKVLDYRTGWFTSQAKIYIESPKVDSAIQFKSELLPFVLGGITIDQHITHGPLIHDEMVGWKFALANIQNSVHHDALMKFFGPNSVLLLNTLVGFGGKYANQLQLPPLSADLMRYKLIWQGLTGASNFQIANQHISAFSSNINLGALSVEGPKFILKTADYNYQDNLKRHDSGLWNGTGSISLPLFSITTDSNQTFEVTNLNSSTRFGVAANNLYNAELTLNIQNIATSDIAFNPVSLLLTIKSLDGKVLSQLSNTLPSDKEQYYTLLPHMITPSTVIDLDVKANSATGGLSIDGEVKWPEMLTVAEDLLEKVNYKVNLRISIALLNQFLDLIDKKQTEDYIKKPLVPTVQNQPVEKPTEMSADLAALVEQKKITATAASQLLSMQQLHISSEVYALAVDALVKRKQIMPEASAQLKTAYDAVQKTDVVTPEAPKEEMPVKYSQMVKKQIEENIKKGYIIQQGSDYVVSFTSEQGKKKVNGIDFDPLSQTTLMTGESVEAPVPSSTPAPAQLSAPMPVMPPAPVQQPATAPME